MEIEKTIQEKIVDVLSTADRPMKALDIARAIQGGCEKRDVNRVIHHMRKVERTNPGQNPPLWQLCTDAASSTTPQFQSGVMSSARDPSIGQGTGRRAGDVASSGSDASLASQLSNTKITIGDEASATWGKKLLATVESVEGSIMIKPVSRDAIIHQAVAGRSSGCNEPSAEHHPVQETGCSNVTEQELENMTSSSERIDPVNLSSGDELKKDLDKETGHDNPSKASLKQKEYASQVLDRTIQTTKQTHCNSASYQQPSSSTPSKSKRKPVIAANFDGVVQTAQAQPLKMRILAILTNTQIGRLLDTYKVSKRLGHENRIQAREALEELKREDKVHEVVEGGVSYWSVKVSK